MDMFDSTLDLSPSSYPVLDDEDMGVPISRDEAEDLSATTGSLKSGKGKEPELVVAEADRPSNPDNFWPQELIPSKLAPCLQEIPKMFKHAWPIKAAGDDRYAKIISPISSFLNSPIPKGQTQPNAKNQGSKRICVSSLLMTVDELIEDEYPLHSSQWEQLGGQASEEGRKEAEKRRSEGWVETDLTKGNGLNKNESGAVTEGMKIYAIDCEMCKTAKGFELTRISILNWDGEVIYDTLVKPTNPITDYLTQYSGMTAALLNPVTTTLADVQSHLLTLFNADTILLGQSLNSDLAAMHFSHPHIIDTSVIYHHSRGPPYKPSLKWLTQKFLRREIQTGGANGHNSIEDAKACLDLLKLKLERGKEFGTADATTESIFKRLGRYPIVPRKGAVVDYGTPQKLYGAYAARTVAAKTDEEVVDGVLACATGREAVDFTWGRLRGLETLRGWRKTTVPDEGVPAVPLDPSEDDEPDKATLAAAVEEVVGNIKKVYDGLPKNTAFIVYSGTGDPREMRRYMDMQREFRAQYQTKKWDEITVKWTDVEDQALKEAVKVARSGLGFLTVI